MITNEIKRTVTNNCISGECSNCGECCTDFLPLTEQDVTRIKAYLGLKHPEIKEQIHTEGNNIHLQCAFRDNANRKCTIYEVRPQICRLFKCDQAFKIMNYNKTKQHRIAKYNYCLDMAKGIIQNTASTHAVFFGNYQWDYDVLYAVVGHNRTAFMSIIYPTLAFKPGDTYGT
jgi:hypothetical protein